MTINTGPRTRGPGTRGPGTRGPGTRGPGTRGPGTQRSSSVALSFYDRNATCVNVLSSNAVRLYRCWSQSPHCYRPLATTSLPHSNRCYPPCWCTSVRVGDYSLCAHG